MATQDIIGSFPMRDDFNRDTVEDVAWRQFALKLCKEHGRFLLVGAVPTLGKFAW